MAKIDNLARVQKQLALVQQDIKNLLFMYKRPSTPPDEKINIVQTLKQLNDEQKQLNKEMEMLISNLHKDVELDIDAAENF